ncbi:hypothetical protein E4K66_32760 [Bradyrhizobium frederickii]|uniref:DUF4357 domain-containing protein n=1 Tax=Bradyrhizobium frederickii TaxID=2560054 RepID=A0A4Y9KSB4_9BRAD|nr:DUF4357 domain-containing protein [Bradyrhizobium frederickii]TFV30959.1 hypothetical protein E4K66_32760 [Bradyrhizobium frederickii]
MNFSPETLQLQPCTHTIYRPFGGIEGYRLISDPTGRLAVTTFPTEMARRLAAGFDQWSACYVLAGNGQAYIAQSQCAMKCIGEHAVDPAKAFATEVFLIHAQEEPRTMDWSTRLFLEHRLTDLAKQAGLVRLANTVEPRVPPWRVERAATLELLATQTRRLLFDAGCRVVDGSLPSRPSAQGECDDTGDGEKAVDIACPTRPAPEEFAFHYCGIWARGHRDHEGHFVVRAGSEVRKMQTTSLRKNIKKLRADLLASGIVMPIVGRKDRLRFQVDWCFFSPAVAAKFVAGAHISATKWVRLPEPIVRTE